MIAVDGTKLAANASRVANRTATHLLRFSDGSLVTIGPDSQECLEYDAGHNGTVAAVIEVVARDNQDDT